MSNFDSEFTKESPRLTPVHSQLRPEDQKVASIRFYPSIVSIFRIIMPFSTLRLGADHNLYNGCRNSKDFRGLLLGLNDGHEIHSVFLRQEDEETANHIQRVMQAENWNLVHDFLTVKHLVVRRYSTSACNLFSLSTSFSSLCVCVCACVYVC